MHKANFQYLGAFRLPPEVNGASFYDYGSGVIALNPLRRSLFVVGYDVAACVGEVSIPAPVNSTDVNALPVAAIVQPLADLLSRIPVNTLAGRDGALRIGGLQVVGGQLVGTVYDMYDAAASAPDAHFALSSLALSSAVTGYYQVGSSQERDGPPPSTISGGYTSGYMAAVPPEWRTALGAPYLTGQAAISIISRTSSGPAVFGFDPLAMRPGGGVTPTVPYLYYPLDHALGDLLTNNPLFCYNTNVKGVIFPPGTSSVIFFGDNGTNTVSYGDAWDPGVNDPYRIYKGPHSKNGDYTYEAWAYDAADFAAVKNGGRQPWEVKPYETWNFNYPTVDGACYSGGCAFDPIAKRLYLAQQGGDQVFGGYMPLIHVYQVV